MKNLSQKQIESEIKKAEKHLKGFEPEYCKCWDKIKISPVKWVQKQYQIEDQFWVIALIGNNCMYLNPIEDGWGWGGYNEYGEISSFHWEQDEIQHAVYKLIFNINN